MYLIVGLGNPGIRFENTFHNSGFEAIDEAADIFELSFSKKAAKALIAEGFYRGEKVILAKPQTYMNLSGQSVTELVNFYKIPLENILIMYDDYDLPLGALRIRAKGSAGTHNGMRDIVEKLGTTEFARVRIGIKPKQEIMGIMDYVLSERGREARELMEPALEGAAKAAEAFVRGESFDEICRLFSRNVSCGKDD